MQGQSLETTHGLIPISTRFPLKEYEHDILVMDDELHRTIPSTKVSDIFALLTFTTAQPLR
jgi:hypothetical protein